jgi:hypothetical protein
MYTMNVLLPTAEQLEKLPMRAVIAYAARTAHRVSSEFRGIVADDILDDALRQVDIVSTTHLLREVDPASVITANERVIAAYVTAPASMKSVEKFQLLFSLVHAALSAMNVLLAVANSSSARHQMNRAAQEALRTVRPLETATFETASAMIDAAKRDYELLLRKYGEHDEVVIGDPIDCFDED